MSLWTLLACLAIVAVSLLPFYEGYEKQLDDLHGPRAAHRDFGIVLSRHVRDSWDKRTNIPGVLVVDCLDDGDDGHVGLHVYAMSAPDHCYPEEGAKVLMPAGIRYAEQIQPEGIKIVAHAPDFDW